MTEKYEKVEGMTVGQIVDAMISGEELYFGYAMNDKAEFKRLTFSLINFKSSHLNTYRKIEAHWWEKHVGGIVMAESIGKNIPVILGEYVESTKTFDCVGGCFQRVRPLTQAEKDAIITEG